MHCSARTKSDIGCVGSMENNRATVIVYYWVSALFFVEWPQWVWYGVAGMLSVWP